MKLRQLNSSIRNNDGAPKIRIKLTEDDTIGITVELTKSGLLNGLKERFQGNDETGIYLDDSGILRFERGD